MIIKYRDALKNNAQISKTKAELFKFITNELCREDYITKKHKPLKKYHFLELMKYLDMARYCADIKEIKVPKFNLDINKLRGYKYFDSKANDKVLLNDLNMKHKLRFNHMINDLRSKWIDSNYELTDEELLDSFINENSIRNYLKE